MAKLLNCKYCKKDFYSKTRNYKQKCCSKSCGQKYSVLIGNKPKLFKKGVSSWNRGLKGKSSHSYGVKFTKIRKENIGKGIIKSYDKIGRKSSKNRLMRKSKQFMEWRRDVFERDNYTCQKCGIRSKKGARIMLHPHHIMHLAKYPEIAFNLDNGITLCYECHQEAHYGIFLTEKLTGKEAVKQ